MAEWDLKNAIRKLPPPLEKGKHKGQAGRVGIIGGSTEYTGAPYFAGITALKCGADLAYIFCMKDAAAAIKSFAPELIVLPFLDDSRGYELMGPRLHNLHALVIGPGLGEDIRAHELIISLIRKIMSDGSAAAAQIPLVFDADGIGLAVKFKDDVTRYAGNVYLTPNANEIKKLASAFLQKEDTVSTLDDVTLMELASRINPSAVLIVKGAVDKIVTADEVKCCSAEGSLRRVGGQGDLLSGSLGLFSHWANLYGGRIESSANGSVSSTILAAYAACYFTRTCSRYAFVKKHRTMITSDMIDQITQVWQHCFNENQS